MAAPVLTVDTPSLSCMYMYIFGIWLRVRVTVRLKSTKGEKEEKDVGVKERKVCYLYTIYVSRYQNNVFNFFLNLNVLWRV